MKFLISLSIVFAASSSLLLGQTGAEEAEARRLNASVVELYSKGKYDEALPLARRALEEGQKAFGPDHQFVATALENLAELYVMKRQYTEAEPLFKRSLAIYEKASGPDSLKAGDVLARLALLQYVKGDYAKAEALSERVIEIREKRLGLEHVQVAQALFNLAELYRLRSAYGKAEPLYARAAAIRVKALGPHHADSLITRYRDRCMLRKLNRPIGSQEVEARPGADTGSQPSRDASATSVKSPVKGGVLNGKAISLPRPPYPEEARASGASGTVTVQVLIDETGRVIDACAISGSSLLWQATEQAASQARFTPTTLSGQPVKVSGVITYNFVRR